MEKLGGVPGAGGAAGREDELESLGLGLFDVDVDLAECFENCPEWNDPLFDTSVLDDLRDCLSDDLWSSPDLQLLTEGDGGAQTESQAQAGPGFIATSPLSPESALSPTPSVASSTLSFSSSDIPYSSEDKIGGGAVYTVYTNFVHCLNSPLFTGVALTGVTGAAAAQNGIVPTQTPAVMDGQQQATGWNVPQAATSPAAVQVLKSGEVVHMMKVSPQPMQQSAGVLWSPPPDLTPPPSVGSPPPAQSNTGLPPVAGGATTAASTSVTPGAGASGGVSRKRQHPDSAAADRHTLESLEKKLQELRRLYTAMPCPPLPPVPSVCSCPAINDTSNSTALRLLSEEMTECFKWYEQHHPRWLHPNRDTQTDTQTDNSLAVVVNSNTASLLRSSGDYQITELRDMPILYKSFKKFFTRKLDTFYLISFKDHLLMNRSTAQCHRTSHPLSHRPHARFLPRRHVSHAADGLLSTDGKCFPCTNRRQSTQGRFLGQVGIVLNTSDHEDLINTALPDYNPTACLLESDSEEDETEEESSAQEDEAAVDASGIPGWDRVDDLAKALAELGRMA
ncbi:hypothetical protein GBAR_LOCUS30493 [Geodia barretti]|uniref:Uncharacterized protein n=1 Tax=Geodia barretti TaxID=519541 RepID=A0AA35TWV1_GEOBA|nr:hypothetical protein GBAR_LOCUS30493 [Geodia barretti]